MFISKVNLALSVAPVFYAQLMEAGDIGVGGCDLADVVCKWAIEAEVGAALFLGGGLA